MQSNPQQGQQRRVGPPQTSTGSGESPHVFWRHPPPAPLQEGVAGPLRGPVERAEQEESGWMGTLPGCPTHRRCHRSPKPTRAPSADIWELGQRHGRVQVSMRGGTEGQRGLTDGEPWRDTCTDPEPRGVTEATSPGQAPGWGAGQAQASKGSLTDPAQTDRPLGTRPQAQRASMG